MNQSINQLNSLSMNTTSAGSSNLGEGGGFLSQDGRQLEHDAAILWKNPSGMHEPEHQLSLRFATMNPANTCHTPPPQQQPWSFPHPSTGTPHLPHQPPPSAPTHTHCLDFPPTRTLALLTHPLTRTPPDTRSRVFAHTQTLALPTCPRSPH